VTDNNKICKYLLPVTNKNITKQRIVVQKGQM